MGALGGLSLVLLLLLDIVTIHSFSTSLYGILGIEREASVKEIKRAYHRLALKLHPDKVEESSSSDPEQMEEIVRKFIEVVSAYEVLSDPVRRKRYDTIGDDAFRSASNAAPGGRNRGSVQKVYSETNFHMYTRFAGGAFEFHYTGSKERRMPDIARTLEVDLEDVFSGCKPRNVTVHRQRICSHCHGSGAHSEDKCESCPVCQGSGFSLFLSEHERLQHNHHHNRADNDRDRRDSGYEDNGEHPSGDKMRMRYRTQQVVNTTCSVCGGTGNVVADEHKCSVCGGIGTIIEPKTYHLNISHIGQRFVFQDGGQAMKFEDGKIVFKIVAKPHRRFKTLDAGNGSFDLLYEARVDLVDALVGFSKFLTHLDGRKIPIVHDIVTFHGYRHTVENEGLPYPPEDGDEGERRGNLVVDFEVVFPRSLTESQRMALREVMDEDDVDVLEDVIRLATATQDAKDWAEERKYSRQCPNRKGSETTCTFDQGAWLGRTHVALSARATVPR